MGQYHRVNTGNCCIFTHYTLIKDKYLEGLKRVVENISPEHNRVGITTTFSAHCLIFHKCGECVRHTSMKDAERHLSGESDLNWTFSEQVPQSYGSAITNHDRDQPVVAVAHTEASIHRYGCARDTGLKLCVRESYLIVIDLFSIV